MEPKTPKKKFFAITVSTIIIINIGIILLMSSSIIAKDVTILFTDSTNIEDAYCYATTSVVNYGRVTSGGLDRVILYVGNNYGNIWRTWMRISSFKDSCDNYSGLIIDSVIGVLFVNTATYDANDEAYIAPVGIDTNMNWVEGNRNGGNAQDCEVCWDSAQTVGSGTCPTKRAWNTAGAAGANDSLGMYTGETEDSTHSGGSQIFDGEAAGDSIFFYLDTVMCNLWKDYAHANEGFAIYTWDSPSDQYYTVFYGSETNGANLDDSIPYFTLYGHTAVVEGELSGRRRRAIILELLNND
jgi:hypothetical protein